MLPAAFLNLVPLALLAQALPPAPQQAPIGRAGVTPPPVASAPSIPGSASPAARLQLTDDAPVQARADLDDRPPQPNEARWSAGPEGDVQVEPGGGDPYFLGFAAGPYFPPADERLDPALIAAVDLAPTDERPAPRVYAFAMFAGRITDERLAELEGAGASVLGFHPSNCVKVALAPEALDTVAYLPFVRWLGVPTLWQKQHPRLAQTRAATGPSEQLDLYVNVYESDLGPDSVELPIGASSRLDAGSVVEVDQATAPRLRLTHSRGWQQRALETLGLEVLEYADSVRAFRVRTLPAAIDALLARDFVQFVEPAEPAQGLHNDSVPMANSDFVRYYLNGGSNQAVVAGQIDSGFDSAHADLNHVWGWGWTFSGTSAWSDMCEHGSHVAGTFLGSGGVDPEYKGNAPGLGWGPAGRFYNIKTSDACTNWTFSQAGALNTMHTPIWDGSVTTPIPHVVNNSWGSPPAAWTGTETEPRLIDNEVYYNGQMYVFAAGNSGPGASTLSVQASSKNAFVVGNVGTSFSAGGALPGAIESDSSRGPTGDFRWKPNISAPGRWIVSTDANSGTGHTFKGGTSMASPHVSGIAALLMDQIWWLRYVPERTASVMMATALTKDGVVLTAPTDAHLSSYGSGRADAFRASFGTAQNTWTNWGTFLPANNYTWADYYVAPGCTRLVVCMHYVEPEPSAGASQALTSDFNLILDAPPIDPAFNVGEYYAQQSPRDNTEIRVINSPVSGTWRWKMWPQSAPQGVYYGLTVMATYGDVTPPVTVTTVPAKTFLKPFEYTDVEVTVANNQYVATNVVLEPQYAQYGGAWANKVTKRLADLIVADDINPGSNTPLVLGDIPATGARLSTYHTRWANEGQWGFISNVRGENVATTSHMGVVTVDGTPPSAVAGLLNLDFPLNVWNTQEDWADYLWDPASDNLAGIAGYSVSLSQNAPEDPDANIDLGGVNWASYITSSPNAMYFNVRAIDACGNVGPTLSDGPLFMDAYPPTPAADLAATAHQVGVPSCNPKLEAVWSASDAHSGVVGFAALWDDQPDTDPGTTVTTTEPTLANVYVVGAPLDAWLHVRTLDAAGHASDVVHYGPFPLEPYGGAQIYCTTKVTGLGCTPQIGFSGTPVVAGGPDDLHVTASGVDGQTTGVLRWGLAPNSAPFAGAGKPNLGHARLGTFSCVKGGGSIAGLASSGTAGACDGLLDAQLGEAWLAAQGLVAGSDLYLQFHFLDPQAVDGSGMGHSDALRLTLCQ